jgi:transcriptional regulator with XRE-family HTH domain
VIFRLGHVWLPGLTRRVDAEECLRVQVLQRDLSKAACPNTDPPQPQHDYQSYSMRCYNWGVPERGDLLRDVMRETCTTQSALSRLSGVRQPSISQFLSGKVELSDDQLDRLLSCMGYRLEVTRRPAVPELTRSERRSWRLHCRLSIRLTAASLEEWRPVIERNLARLRGGVTGQPHSRNLDRWESLVGHGDVLSLHRVLTGLDRDSIEMREVSPMSGLLPQDERQAALREGRADATRPA